MKQLDDDVSTKQCFKIVSVVRYSIQSVPFAEYLGIVAKGHCFSRDHPRGELWRRGRTRSEYLEQTTSTYFHFDR